MDLDIDFQPVYPHHDLLVELGEVEMAIEGLDDCANDERDSRQPVLESRMQSLQEALRRLAA